MSVEAVKWAFYTAKCETPLERLVLAALAERADKYGQEARPSQATLARDTCLSPRHLRRTLAELEKRGLIERDLLSRPGWPISWNLNLTGKALQGGPTGPGGAAARGRRGRPYVAYKPSITTQEPSSTYPAWGNVGTRDTTNSYSLDVSKRTTWGPSEPPPFPSDPRDPDGVHAYDVDYVYPGNDFTEAEREVVIPVWDDARTDEEWARIEEVATHAQERYYAARRRQS